MNTDSLNIRRLVQQHRKKGFYQPKQPALLSFVWNDLNVDDSDSFFFLKPIFINPFIFFLKQLY